MHPPSTVGAVLRTLGVQLVQCYAPSEYSWYSATHPRSTVGTVLRTLRVQLVQCYAPSEYSWYSATHPPSTVGTVLGTLRVKLLLWHSLQAIDEGLACGQKMENSPR